MTLHQALLLSGIFLAVFLVVFGVARTWDRPSRHPVRTVLLSAGIAAAVLVLGVAGLLGFFYYAMGVRVTAQVNPPLTVAEARAAACPIPLPNSAQHVQFVMASGGLQALEILVRFQAPLPACRDEAQQILQHEANISVQPRAARPELLPIVTTPRPEDHDMAGRAAWFDVENIRHGWSAEDASTTQVWVDADRAIFYCKITD